MVAKREEWKLQITSKNKQMREERMNRKAEFSKYKCKECNYTGMSQKNLEIHEKNGIHKSQEKCELKKAVCYTWDYYCKDPSDPMVAICNECGKRIRMGRNVRKVSTGHLRFHLKTKHVDSFNTLQLKTFERKLQQKMKLSKKTEGKKFKCDMFNCKGRKTMHAKSVHFSTIDKNINCDECDFKTLSINGLSGHKGKEHPRAKIMIETKSDEIFPKTKKYVYPCTFCDYKGSSTQGVRKHESSVHLNIRFKCDTCEYKARTKEDLQRHIRSVHDKVKIKCDLCDFETTSRTLSSHKAAKHMNLIYFCSDCEL